MVSGFFDPVEGALSKRLDRYRCAIVAADAPELPINPSHYRFGGHALRRKPVGHQPSLMQIVTPHLCTPIRPPVLRKVTSLDHPHPIWRERVARMSNVARRYFRASDCAGPRAGHERELFHRISVVRLGRKSNGEANAQDAESDRNCRVCETPHSVSSAPFGTYETASRAIIARCTDFIRTHVRRQGRAPSRIALVGLLM
jgi:hypothetical protein